SGKFGDASYLLTEPDLHYTQVSTTPPPAFEDEDGPRPRRFASVLVVALAVVVVGVAITLAITGGKDEASDDGVPETAVANEGPPEETGIATARPTDETPVPTSPVMGAGVATPRLVSAIGNRAGLLRGAAASQALRNLPFAALQSVSEEAAVAPVERERTRE